MAILPALSEPSPRLTSDPSEISGSDIPRLGAKLPDYNNSPPSTTPFHDSSPFVSIAMVLLILYLLL